MRPSHAQIPRLPEPRLLRAVHLPAGSDSDSVDPGALGDLVACAGGDVADKARAALTPLLPHDALILVTPASPGFPVQISAPRGLREGLAAIEWMRMVDGTAPDGTAARLPLTKLDLGLDVAGWVATSGRLTISMIIATSGRLELGPASEHAAMLIASLVAARARRVDHDPPPGTLAFSRAVSQERERIRAELSSRHSATLSGMLQPLRGATWSGGSRTAPPEVSEAIEVASRALLDLDTSSEPHDESGRVLVSTAFDETETEVRGIVHAARLRVLADTEACENLQIPRAIGQAARIV